MEGGSTTVDECLVITLSASLSFSNGVNGCRQLFRKRRKCWLNAILMGMCTTKSRIWTLKHIQQWVAVCLEVYHPRAWSSLVSFREVNRLTAVCFTALYTPWLHPYSFVFGISLCDSTKLKQQSFWCLNASFFILFYIFFCCMGWTTANHCQRNFRDKFLEQFG